MALFNNFPYSNTEEINLDYTLNKLNELYSRGENLYAELQTWKTETDEANEAWKSDLLSDINEWQNSVTHSLEEWKTSVDSEVSNALTTLSNQITEELAQAKTDLRNEVADLASAAATSAADAVASQSAAAQSAETAINSATAAAQSEQNISASAEQIETNKNDITDLKSALNTTNETIYYKLLPLTFEVGGLNSQGATNTIVTRMRSEYVHVFKDDIIVINEPYEFCAYEFNLSGTYIQFSGLYIDHYTKIYKALSNANVIFVAKRTDDGNIESGDLSSVRISVYRDEFKVNYTENAFSPDYNVITGKVVLMIDGSLNDSINYETTDFIPVKPGDIIVYNAICYGQRRNSNDTGLAGYDEGKAFVGALAGPYASHDIYTTTRPSATVYKAYTYDILLHETIEIPNGVYYIRSSSYIGELSGYYAQHVSITRIPNTNRIDSNGRSQSVIYEQGTLDPDGAEGTASTRVRTKFIDLKDGIVNARITDQKVAFVLYASDRTFLYNSGWKYNDFSLIEIGSARYARFVVAEMDDANITPSDVDAEIVQYTDAISKAEQGNTIGNGFTDTPYSETIKVINHRGYNSIAPENTIPAFKLARKMGFATIETDVQLTSDSKPVILHDKTINRTSNGTGNVYDKTLEQLKALDFGSWKSSMWTGTQIPTFEEMVACCKNIGLNVYIELKKESPWTSALVADLVETVRKYGMIRNVTWISSDDNLLGWVISVDAKARIGIIRSTCTISDVDTALTFLTGENEVFIGTWINTISASVVEYMVEKNVPLCEFLIDSCDNADAMHAYASEGITNEFNFAKYIYDQNIN